MFKQSSFEKDLFEGMKNNLQKNAKEQSLEIEKKNLKIAQNLNAIKSLLEDNGFKAQAEVVSKYINKKASKTDVINSFDNNVKFTMSKEVNKKIAQHFAKSDFGNDAIIKMLFVKEANEMDSLFSSSKRIFNPFSGSQPQDMFNKNSFKENQVLSRISKLTDSLEQEIDINSSYDGKIKETFED